MSSNYWASTQHLHWEVPLVEAKTVSENGDSVLVKRFPLPERSLFNQYLQHQINKLGKRLNTRQVVLATTQVFVLRFYKRVEIRTTNPYLVVATALYMACKIEECPHHIRIVVSEARTLWPDFIQADTSKLGECEFSIISELKAQLVVHHPYRSLSDLQERLSLTLDDVALAWSVINDHYLTDMALRFAPHIIATTAIVLVITMRPGQSSVQGHSTAINGPRLGFLPSQTVSCSPSIHCGESKGQKLTYWLTQSGLDIEAVIACTQEVISLYVALDNYNEKTCREQISRFVQALGLDK